MATSQRLSRGFHRVGLFLAAIILLVGVSYWLKSAAEDTGYIWRSHKALVCAHDFLQRDQKRFWDLALAKQDDIDESYIDLEKLGCTDTAPVMTVVQFGEVRGVTPSFSWISAFGSQLLFTPLLIPALAAIIIALAVYLLVRAIGWVIGGFTAS